MTAHHGVPVAVVNPSSGTTTSVDELRDVLVGLVAPGAVDWFETGPDDLGDAVAARAVAAGAPTVIACGDDSTVRLCLEAVAGTATSLGIVSLGPGSLLASNLGLTPGLDSVADAVSGPTRHLDVGEANGEVFAVMAGFGVDVLVGSGANRGMAGALAMVRQLRRRLSRVTVHVDGVQRFAGVTPCLLVANCPGGPGRVAVVPDADPTDAQLDLAVLAPRNPIAWAEVMWRLLTGQPQRQEHVLRLQGDWVHVQSWRARAYELDGDPRQPATRLDVQVWPAALSVRTPSDAEPTFVTDVDATDADTGDADTAADGLADDAVTEHSVAGHDGLADDAVAGHSVAGHSVAHDAAVEDSVVEDSVVENADSVADGAAATDVVAGDVAADGDAEAAVDDADAAAPDAAPEPAGTKAGTNATPAARKQAERRRASATRAQRSRPGSRPG